MSNPNEKKSSQSKKVGNSRQSNEYDEYEEASQSASFEPFPDLIAVQSNYVQNSSINSSEEQPSSSDPEEHAMATASSLTRSTNNITSSGNIRSNMEFTGELGAIPKTHRRNRISDLCGQPPDISLVRSSGIGYSDAGIRSNYAYPSSSNDSNDTRLSSSQASNSPSSTLPESALALNAITQAIGILQRSLESVSLGINQRLGQLENRLDNISSELRTMQSQQNSRSANYQAQNASAQITINQDATSILRQELADYNRLQRQLLDQERQNMFLKFSELFKNASTDDASREPDQDQS